MTFHQIDSFRMCSHLPRPMPTIKFQSQQFELSPMTVQEALQHLQELLNSELGNPRFIHKGKQLSLEQLLPDGQTMVLCTSKTAIEKVNAQDEKFQQASKNYQMMLKTRPKTQSEPEEYYCETIETLGLSNDHKAKKLLHEIRTDFGVRSIMKKYGWRIGRLIELHPDEHTILGYNQNKGQVIALRLRTDDLEGFRTFDSIRKVMLHELSHQVHSEHDEHFHALNRQLNKECDSYHRGSRVDAGRVSETHHYQEDTNGRVLGGRNKDGSMREILLQAATVRLTQQEQELVDSCGNKH
ncbi:WLM domain-containing protein [Gorgonomyces haynaldii]|nr:WLM domain-containing protein [Gorgonomyces haynaldii]